MDKIKLKMEQKRFNREDVYSFDVMEQINQHGEQCGGIRHVTIIFLNGKFDHCAFDFHGKYTRENWRVLAVINDKIAELEEVYRERSLRNEI